MLAAENPQPFRVVRSLYAQAGRTRSPEAERAMKARMDKNRRDKREAHHYHAADFGLSEAQIKRDFADYLARYIEAAA